MVESRHLELIQVHVPLTFHVEHGRQAQALLVHGTVGLVVLQLAEKRVGVAQGFHNLLDHVTLRHWSLKKLGVTSDIFFAVSFTHKNNEIHQAMEHIFVNMCQLLSIYAD